MAISGHCNNRKIIISSNENTRGEPRRNHMTLIRCHLDWCAILSTIRLLLGVYRAAETSSMRPGGDPRQTGATGEPLSRSIGPLTDSGLLGHLAAEHAELHMTVPKAQQSNQTERNRTHNRTGLNQNQEPERDHSKIRQKNQSNALIAGITLLLFPILEDSPTTTLPPRFRRYIRTSLLRQASCCLRWKFSPQTNSTKSSRLFLAKSPPVR